LLIGCQATTLHHWAGLRDNRYGNEQLLNLLKNDISFNAAKHKVLTAEVLIIDEISMVSNIVFSQLEYICRKLRGNDFAFGGLQVIVCGDFRQLKPVPNYYDPGDYCFMSEAWKNAITHVIQLREVHRTHDKDLVKCINELSSGEISEGSNKLLMSLARPLPDGDTVYLYARNFDAELTNYDYLFELPGVEKTYTAEQTGNIKALKTVRAPKHLVLKVHCKVMLLANLTSQLVNGTLGTVSEMHDNHCVVNFENIGNIDVMQHTFSVYSREEERNMATRKQLPLKLAYAITIHKAQGMSLDSVIVNASFTSKPGHLATAVGRAKQRDGLRVINYDPTIVLKQPAQVIEYYASLLPAVPCLVADHSCCKRGLAENEQIDYPIGQSVSVDADDGDVFAGEGEEETIELIAGDVLEDLVDDNEAFEASQSDFISEEFDMTIIRTEVGETFSSKETEEQCKLDACNPKISDNTLSTFLNTCYNNMKENSLPLERKGRGKMESKDFTEFLKKNCTFQDSSAYDNLVSHLCSHEVDVRRRLADKYFRCLQHKFLDEFEKRSRLTVTSQSATTSQSSISDISKAGIRYLSGMCFAKAKYKLSTYIINNIHKTKERDNVMNARKKVSLLNSHIVSQDKIKSSTKEPASLQTIVRKQNIREGLTHITDDVFLFFMNLDEQLAKTLTTDSFKEHRGEIFVFAENEMWRNKEIYRSWSILFPDGEKDIVSELMEITLVPYFHVRANQFRKDHISELREKKSLEIRKEVWNKRSKLSANKAKSQSETKKITFSDIVADASPCDSHKRLKELGVHIKGTISKFSKAQLQTLAQMYGKNVTQKVTKQKLIDILEHTINTATEMSGHDVALDVQVRPAKRSRDVPENTDEDYRCPICGELRLEDSMWVGCDNDECGQFICRICAKLEEEEDYLKAVATKWTCPFC
jgi:DNA-binding TFAR19-related protein (PDSD5 family)